MHQYKIQDSVGSTHIQVSRSPDYANPVEVTNIMPSGLLQPTMVTIQIGLTQAIEVLQKAFFNRIDGMHHLNYWDQLTQLKSYSLERRRERYQMIYTWRIIEGQVLNFECTPIESYQNGTMFRKNN